MRRSRKKNKKEEEEKPKVHKDLEGFEVNINSLGEITSSIDKDKINEFLNKNLYDKKLKNKEAKKEGDIDDDDDDDE
ncbi:MAG: hypothetical protein JJT94_07995 [Bernardetiaceae bacterium]|nr:hypothetical protein [Bernardetiaceae bacterium]